MKKQKTKQATYRDRQKEKGLIAVSVYIWSWQREDLKDYAKKLRERGEREISE